MKGFVDLQVNGYQGVDFSAPGLNLKQIRYVVETLRARGTIAFCPTVITSSTEIYKENLPVLAAAMEERDLAPHLLGIHLEGPFISKEEGARGAHLPQNIIPPDVYLYEQLLDWARGRICLLTLAPELPGAGDLIRKAVERGQVVSLGHHLADRDAIRQACQAGVVAVTHLGNGIPNLLPRHPNPLWDQLDEAALCVMLIADGHHVPKTFLRVVARLKGPDKMVVVSDSAPPAGLSAGHYETLGQEVVLEEDGRLWNPAGDHLAGSSCCLMECMNYLASLALFSEKELWLMGHENPLALIGKELDSQAFEAFSDVVFEEDKFVIRVDTG